MSERVLAWMVGLASALGVAVYVVMQALGRRKPSKAPDTPTRPMHEAAMEKERQVVAQAEQELEERRTELHDVAEATDPDVRSQATADLLNRRR